MKKTLLFAALLATGLTVNAQTKFGVKVGAQLSDLIDNKSFDAKDKIGFQVGGFANILLTEKLSFQPELLYSFQGAKLESTDVYTTHEGTILTAKTDVNFNLSYLQLPLMMKWKATKNFNVEFGPQVGLKLTSKAKGDITLSGNEIHEKTKIDEKLDDIESFDFGLNLGVGYEIEGGFNLGVRYGLGLTEIAKDTDIKNSVFSLALGYTFK